MSKIALFNFLYVSCTKLAGVYIIDTELVNWDLFLLIEMALIAYLFGLAILSVDISDEKNIMKDRFISFLDWNREILVCKLEWNISYLKEKY